MNPAIREAIEKAISTCWPKSVAHGQCNDCEAHHAAIRNVARVVLEKAASEADSFDPHEDEKLDVPTSIGAAIRALMPTEPQP